MQRPLAFLLALLSGVLGQQCLAQSSPTPGISTVSPKNAGDMADSCTASFAGKNQVYAKLICTGWIDGVVDGANFQSRADRARPSVCMPALGSHDAALATFAQFVAAHSDARKAPAAIILMIALAEKFPCGKP